MDFGIQIFCTDKSVSPAEVARMAEERGFESLFLPEHTHIPASRETPYPAGGELPDEYTRILDPFVACTQALAATERLKVGTGVCIVTEHDPIVCAKEVASIDLLSGGRFLFGVGAGWNEEEMRNHGTDPRRRFSLMRERIEAMKAMWTEDEASYHGEFVDFDRIWSFPKPVQDPHPPILVGGYGRTVKDRVLAYGDEWMPIRIEAAEEPLFGRIERMRELVREEAGRELGVTLTVAPTDPAGIERYAQVGVHRCTWWVPPAGRDKVEPAMDRYAEVVARYREAG